MVRTLLVLAAALAYASVAHTIVSTGSSPEQIHIAYRGLNYDMAVSWLTPVMTPVSEVKYGPASGVYPYLANGSCSSYYSNNYVHHVVLEGLLPSTTYYYIVGGDASGWSTEFNFTTAPTSATKSYKAFVYGDMGVDHSGSNTQQLIAHKDDVDFIFHIGDFSYADDRLLTSDFDEVWDQWMNQVQPLAAYKPYMVMPGNHEATCHSFGDFFCPDGLKNFTSYNARFRMPAEESGSGTNMWQSWDYGNTHFIAIDTETDYPHAPEGIDTIFKAGGFGDQLAWLQADLAKANANRAERPWIIIGGHRPLYTARKQGLSSIIWPNTTGHLRAFVEDLFNEYNVDLYLCGHVHAYERNYPVYRGSVVKSYNNPEYLTSVIIGCAGNIEGHQNSWVDPLPEWCAVHNGENYGYGVLEVHNDTALSWTFYSATDSAVLDAFSLTKDHSTGPATASRLRGSA